MRKIFTVSVALAALAFAAPVMAQNNGTNGQGASHDHSANDGADHSGRAKGFRDTNNNKDCGLGQRASCI